jgi:diacylglycerol kinase family enzyme
MIQEALAPPRRVLVVANPISGRGRGERLARALVQGFGEHGVASELLLTAARGDAPRLLAAAGPADRVVAVGGDGTLSEVLQGLPQRSTPVGLLPCGTANVLAHALGLPRQPERALAGFLGGRIQALDVARVGARFAHLAVGVGFDARVVEAVEARRRGPITKAAYVAAILRTLLRHRPVPLRVWIDGHELARPVGMIWIANTPKYADVLRFAHGTRLDDGRWEAYLFPTGRTSELLGAALRGVLLHLPGGPIGMQQARSVRIESREPVPYQVDGDLGGTTPLEFELLPERFRLVVP